MSSLERRTFYGYILYVSCSLFKLLFNTMPDVGQNIMFYSSNLSLNGIGGLLLKDVAS